MEQLWSVFLLKDKNSLSRNQFLLCRSRFTKKELLMETKELAQM